MSTRFSDMFGESALDDSALDDVPEYGSVTRNRGDGDTAAVTDSIFEDDDNYVGDADGETDGAAQDPALSGSSDLESATEQLSESFGASALRGDSSIADAFGATSLPDRPEALSSDGGDAIPSWVFGAGGALVAGVLAIALGGSDE